MQPVAPRGSSANQLSRAPSSRKTERVLRFQAAKLGGNLPIRTGLTNESPEKIHERRSTIVVIFDDAKRLALPHKQSMSRATP